MARTIKADAEFHTSANTALLIIAGQLLNDMRTISRLSPLNPLSVLRAKRIARGALERRTVQPGPTPSK